MKRTIPALILHVVIIVAIISVVGGLGLIADAIANEGNEKFTGELETNITLRILENDTAKEQGYLKELL